MTSNSALQVDMALREHAMSLCAPIWWESARQFVVNSATMCVVQTPAAILGITNNHVLEAYERHRVEKEDVFCQLGAAPFDPSENLIDRSPHWDLATFAIPALTLQHWGYRLHVAKIWPPSPIEISDNIVFGGYLEVRRALPEGAEPPNMSIDFVSFRSQPKGCSREQVSFQIDPAQLTWLPNVEEPLAMGASWSGMSGGPCFRLVPKEGRIELAGFIYEGASPLGIIFARQACLISADGSITV